MGWEEISKAGATAFQNGDYGEAERHFANAVSEANRLGQDDRRLAHAMNDLAMFYHALGRLAEAEPLYRRAISIDERSGVAGTSDCVVTLENIAELYRTQHRVTEAAAMYRRAAEMSRSLYRAAKEAAGDNHPDRSRISRRWPRSRRRRTTWKKPRSSTAGSSPSGSRCWTRGTSRSRVRWTGWRTS